MNTGDVLATMEHLAEQGLPKNMTYEWTELSYLQKQASKVEEFRDLRQNPAQRVRAGGGAGLLRVGRSV